MLSFELKQTFKKQVRVYGERAVMCILKTLDDDNKHDQEYNRLKTDVDALKEDVQLLKGNINPRAHESIEQCID